MRDKEIVAGNVRYGRTGSNHRGMMALRATLPLAVVAALSPLPAFAACDIAAPAGGQTVTCDAAAPNPYAQPVTGAAGVDGVTVDVLSGSELSLFGVDANIGAVGSGWRVVNAGRIGGTGANQAAAVRLSGVDNRLDNTGTIANRTQAVVMGARAQLNNTGSIFGQSDGASLGDSARVDNSGQISAGLRTGLAFGADGQLVNRASGRIDGGTQGFGVFAASAVRVENFGTISGHDGAVATNGGDSYLFNAASGVLEATGASHAALELGGGNDTVINEGAIRGIVAMYLGAGDDTLVLRTGASLRGIANGDAGNDTVRFEGSGDLGISTGLVGFENVVLSADSRWAMGGPLDAGAAVARFDIADRAQLDLSGRLSGGGLRKGGAGSLRLSGDNSAFVGTSFVDAGSLRVDGSLGGRVEVAAGALLQGGGQVGSVDNAGTIAPGAGLGVLTVAGDYRHRVGAILQADVSAAGVADLLRVGGRATLDGGEVQVVKAPGQYAGGTRYVLVDAAGGLAGRFAALTQNQPFLQLSLAYDANRVYLDVARSATRYGEVCASFNQCASAALIDAIATRPNLGPDIGSVLDELSTLDVGGARSALASVAGEAHPGLAQIVAGGLQSQQRSLHARMGEVAAGDREPGDRGGAWVVADHASGEFDARQGLQAADYRARGLAVGADAGLGEHWLLGAALHANDIDADFAAGDRGRADARGVSLYAAYLSERFYAQATARASRWDNRTDRIVRVGSISRAAHADYDGRHLGASFEIGLNYSLGDSLLQPLLSLDADRIEQDAFVETGAGDLNLSGRRQRFERADAGLGLRWSHRFDGAAWSLRPSLQARWLHSVGDRTPHLEASLAGAPDLSLRSRGLAMPADYGELGLDLRARRGDHLELSLGYRRQGSGFESHAASAGIRWSW